MSGRTFLQIPGPTNVPEPVLAALREATMNPRGPEFAGIVHEVLAGLRPVFGTTAGRIVVSAGSGLVAIESAFVNTLAPNDQLLCLETGFFGARAGGIATAIGVAAEQLRFPLGEPPDPNAVEARLRQDRERRIKAVLVVHNETATGVTSDLPAIRAAIDAADHPALLIVDAVSSLASIETRMDDWGLDVVVAGCQKGLMCPPGLAVVAVSAKAIAVAETGGSPRSFFDWRPMLAAEESGMLPVTSPTPLFCALRAALRLIAEEGMPAVYRRHARLAEGVRRAVSAWDLATICTVDRAASNSITGVHLPEGVDSAAVVAAGTPLGLQISGGLLPLRETTIRIGHMGALNELEVLATVGGTEHALRRAGAPVALGGGLQAAQDWFEESRPA